MSSQLDPSQVLFARAVIARLAVWPVLRVAIDSSWGGPESKEKKSWMAGEIVDAFQSAPNTSNTSNTLTINTNSSTEPDEVYIEEMLLQMMSDEFDCVIEDLSGEEVARDIVKLWQDTKDGSIENAVKLWEDKERAMTGKKMPFTPGKKGDDTDWVDDDEDGSSEDDDEEEMEVDEAPTLVDTTQKKEPIVDEDGFTLIQGKRKTSNRG
jgi:pre-rRNA-processing protein TSR2